MNNNYDEYAAPAGEEANPSYLAAQDLSSDDEITPRAVGDAVSPPSSCNRPQWKIRERVR
jgi:hypothetical protein